MQGWRGIHSIRSCPACRFLSASRSAEMRRLHHAVRGALLDRYESLDHRHESYKWWVLANVMIGTFMAVLDATIVNVGLPKIMASFGVGIDKIEWVITAYMLSMAVMLLT